jgi:(1->4)-alpha-D-glucan 1-alpha-D-glucosylmutase
LLKLACPGVPDFYQGSETWDLRLVDPDNRTPVCFQALDAHLRQVQELPKQIEAAEMETLLARWHDGRIKLHLIQSVLAFRRAHEQLFENGVFEPVVVTGKHADRALAFCRSNAHESAVIVIPRCVASLKAPLDRVGRGNFWSKTLIEIPEGSTAWRNVLSLGATELHARDGRLSLGEVFEQFPVALLAPAV